MVVIFVLGSAAASYGSFAPSIAKQTHLVCVRMVNDMRSSRGISSDVGLTPSHLKHRAIHDRIAATDDVITGGCEALGFCVIPDEVDGYTDCHAL